MIRAFRPLTVRSAALWLGLAGLGLAHAQTPPVLPAETAVPEAAASPKATPNPAATAASADPWGNWEARPARPAHSLQDVQAQALQAQVETPNDVLGIRASALQEQALEFGAQAGLAHRAREIKASVDARSVEYDRVFRFDSLMLEPGLLPPVINEGRDAYQQTGDTKVRAAMRIYTIQFPARLVNTAPKWQEYLGMSYPDPRLPHPSLLPKDKDEKAIWDRWVANGWEQGIKQADQVFEASVARLQRDFEGMIRYKTLHEQGLVTKPVLAKSHLGVTGGGTEMAIDDRIFEITVPSGLDPNKGRWRHDVPVTHATDIPVAANSGKGN